mmetsp:Transcript_8647/g.39344  ORF Transcript_8647/g.39344 Transcript_8647/m.39344 type:complete len:236 (-) Transcript_8647:2785-3492(-)
MPPPHVTKTRARASPSSTLGTTNIRRCPRAMDAKPWRLKTLRISASASNRRPNTNQSSESTTSSSRWSRSGPSSGAGTTTAPPSGSRAHTLGIMLAQNLETGGTSPTRHYSWAHARRALGLVTPGAVQGVAEAPSFETSSSHPLGPSPRDTPVTHGRLGITAERWRQTPLYLLTATTTATSSRSSASTSSAPSAPSCARTRTARVHSSASSTSSSCATRSHSRATQIDRRCPRRN